MTMTSSIIINNHNYGQYVGDAIDSALQQTCVNEVVVVDDGSTDDSRDVIDAYRSQVRIVHKDNGGQASAFNAGLQASKGDVIIFLDADDMLLPEAVENANSRLGNEATVKVHWPLWVVDAQGRRTGRKRPAGALPAGDLRAAALRQGPATMLSSPTSGNAWRRDFLLRFGPVPEDLYRICADKYLVECAFFAGNVARIEEPQGLYRKHGDNRQRGAGGAERLQRELRLYDHYASVLRNHAESQNLRVDFDAWLANSWWHQQARALEELELATEGSGNIVLIDDDRFEGAPIGTRTASAFNGEGRPASTEEAITCVKRHRERGASWLAIAWPGFWWLEHYDGFARYLRNTHTCVLNNERIVVFDLRENESNAGGNTR
jgi:glycosyltransferase involved in cell wall biosynthesis